jgi:serine/threonine protein kinase
MNERESIETLFLEVVDLPPEQRPTFLDQRCAGDPHLKAAVEKLLAADREAGEGEFLRSNLFGKQDAASSHTGDFDEAAGADANRFRVLRAHREGGLGEVLLAHDRQLDRDVAVKQIKPRWRDSVEARQRFIQEAKVTGRLEHPGIVPVYAMGTWPDGQHYYAMRFIEGDTMKDAIDRYHQPVHSSSPADDRRLQMRDLLSRFVDVCNTIQYAHSKKILHRDIKPSNIMVGPYGETLVVDWGLAKLLDEPVEESMTADFARALGSGSGSTPTQVGGTVGTPNYMSPEQAAGKLDEIGTRTDVYLLGATLYQILTGRPPHQADSVAMLLKQVGQGRLTPPREFATKLSPALEAICLKAMAANPADRYADANEIADDINRWMADQPVSIHSDGLSVRLNRWMRHHRTATATIVVATILLSIGGILGSILWNEAQLRRFQANNERVSKQLQRKLNEQQRIAELATTANAAAALAGKEIARGSYNSALQILQSVLPGIESEVELVETSERVGRQADRLAAIVDFYRLADETDEQNILSRDTKALMAGTEALKRLGVWDRQDWWTAIPDQDLSPTQIDALRWDVYRHLMLMDAMLVKSIGVRLSGDDRIGGVGSALRAAARMLTTDAGKQEAVAVIRVSDRIDRFRLSESSRLYRSIAQLRLGTGTRLHGEDLGPTQNAADAHSLAVLSMIAAIDPSFELFFRGYQGDDALLASRELFRRSVSLRPDFYSAHLGLGQVEYLVAHREPSRRWEDYEASLGAFGHCITLLPDRCFARADRSSIYRAQSRLIAVDDRYEEPERRQRMRERLRWSLTDAEHAMKSYPKHPWVGWQAGLALAEIGQTRRAIDRWIQTARDVYPLGEISDSTFVKVDDLRGRAEIGQWLEDLLRRPESGQDFDLAAAFTALAGVRLNQARRDDALRAAESALSIDPDTTAARAIRAMVLLSENANQSAKVDFQAVNETDPDHPWAAFGLARCAERSGELERAATRYRAAERLVLTDENRAAAALGLCRTAALSGDRALADQAVRRAIASEPACDLMSVVRPIATQLRDWKRSGEVPRDRIDALTRFARSLAELPRPGKVEAMPDDRPESLAEASIFNGGFELGSMRYWIGPSGAEWESVSGSESTAAVTNQFAHSGEFSLRIDVPSSGDASPAGTVGRTGQQFSLVAGHPHEVVCWVKADRVAESAIRIVGPGDQVIIRFDRGSYDWRRVTGRLLISQDPSGRRIKKGSIVPCGLRLVATGPGTLWLDDLVCRTLAAE